MTCKIKTPVSWLLRESVYMTFWGRWCRCKQFICLSPARFACTVCMRGLLGSLCLGRSSMRAVRGDRLSRCQTGSRLIHCRIGSGLELECFIRASEKVAVRRSPRSHRVGALRIPLCIQVGDRVFAWGTVVARQFHTGSGAVETNRSGLPIGVRQFDLSEGRVAF